LVDIHGGHDNARIWSVLPPDQWGFCILVGMLMFISLYDTGFLDLMGLTGLAFAKARTLLRALPDIFSQILIVLRGTLASTAQLQPSCRSFFW
jgi:hypothetical protein